MTLEAVRVAPGMYVVPCQVTLADWVRSQEQLATWRLREAYVRLTTKGARHRMTLTERFRQYWYNGVHGNHYDTKFDKLAQKFSRKILRLTS